MNMKKFWALMLSLAMALSLAACGGDSGSSDGDAANDAEGSGDKVVRIGVFEPATGDSGPGGKQEMLGMQYANQETPTVDIGGQGYHRRQRAGEQGRLPGAGLLWFGRLHRRRPHL